MRNTVLWNLVFKKRKNSFQKGEHMKEYIENIIAPRVQGDGGWIEYEELDGSQLTVVLRGECSRCNKAALCMKWIEDRIYKDMGKTIQIKYRCVKPYFLDK